MITRIRTKISPRSRGSFERLRHVLAAATAAAWLISAAAPLLAADWSFRLQFDKAVRQEAFNGRVYVFFSKTRKEPRVDVDWFNPELFIARDVVGWQPGEPLTLSTADPDGLLAFPQPLAEMALAGYRAQAVVRFNLLDPRIGEGTGNGYSQVLAADGADPHAVLAVERVVQPREFVESPWCKLLRVRSESLSEFYGREVFQEAAVVLPAGYYENPTKRYPTIYSITGFGGSHYDAMTDEPVHEQNPGGVEFLRVHLDPSCPLGHHVFADSANNGPVGTALVSEFIPEFDRRFRSIAAPPQRFLIGHSSGGWASLWLQITWPELFGGTWSTSPDPVDFRDFQRINLYREGENMYRDPQGQRRPIARRGEQVRLWYDSFAHLEWVLGPGGQLHSFEASFSPRGKDGNPLLLWDRDTGAIDTAVARTWERYDVRLVLERNWKTLGPKLAGRLHVFMGDQDTFYLEGATKLLKESLATLGSDAVVEIHAGKDHSTLLSRELKGRMRREMSEAALRDGR